MQSFVLEGPGGIAGLKQVPSGSSVVTKTNWHFTGNVVVDGTFSAATEVAQVITSASANAFTVGPNGITNPVFNVNASTTSSVTGLNIISAASGAGVQLNVTSTATNESLKLNPKGSGGVNITSTSTNALAVGPNGGTTPTLAVNSNTASAVTGVAITGAAATAGVAVKASSSATNENMTISAKGSGTVTINAASVLTSGGLAGSSVLIGASSLGVYVGTGSPTISAAQGSIYLNNAGSSTTTRIYINSDGGTTWVAVTTAS